MYRSSLKSILWIILSFGIAKSQVLDLETIQVGDQVDARFAHFELPDNYVNDQDLPLKVLHISEIEDLFLVVISRTHCAAMVCPQELFMYLIEDGKIIHRHDDHIPLFGNPSFDLLHEKFIVYTELRPIWSKEEPKGEPIAEELHGIRLVIHKGKILPFTELNKNELRICRNWIFARYGYSFSSDDLREYFQSQNWYQPEAQQDYDALLTEKDRELINYIKELEKE